MPPVQVSYRRFYTAALVVLGLMAQAAPAQAQSAVPLAPPPIYLQPGGAPRLAEHGRQQQTYVIGGSLTHFVGGVLPHYFPGWGVGVNAWPGRHLSTGMDILARTAIPNDGSIILAMGLGTNDSPRALDKMKAAVFESLRRVGPDGCAVWATIYRPPVNGFGYAAMNRMLRRLADQEPRMRLVDWSRSLRRSPVAMDHTGVHPATFRGWQRRAAMFADAIRSC